MGYNADDYAAMEDAYDSAMGYDKGPDLSTNVDTGDNRDDDRDSDPFAGTVGIAAPKALPSGVVDYTSPNLIQSIISPRSVSIGDVTKYGGGLNISPYDRGKVSFGGGRDSIVVDPLGGGRDIIEMDMGRSPIGDDDRNFIEKAIDAVVGIPKYQNQRAAIYDPLLDRYETFKGVLGPTTTLEKTSDNFIEDALVNIFNPFKALTGFVDTKTYKPLTGGEAQQYSKFSGGLLSNVIGDNMVPYSQLRERQKNLGIDGGGGDGRDGRDSTDRPLIVPEEVASVDPVTGEPTAFPQFTPRTYEYQPFTSKFYTIPSRFTQPNGLLA